MGKITSKIKSIVAKADERDELKTSGYLNLINDDNDIVRLNISVYHKGETIDLTFDIQAERLRYVADKCSKLMVSINTGDIYVDEQKVEEEE